MTAVVHQKSENPAEFDRQREAASLALQQRPGFDIATLDEEEFDRGLELMRKRFDRMQRILDTALVEKVHYGNPELSSGRKAFQRPMLYQAGAEELRRLFRLTPRYAEPPTIEQSEGYCSVVVTIELVDGAGRVVARRTGSCNSLEKRFEARKGGYTYTDAREVVHQCITMAEKRAATLATREATGATGFFAAEEEMEKALAEGEAEEQHEPWTDEERNGVIAAARRAGIKTKSALVEFVKQTLGTDRVGTGRDVGILLDALTSRTNRGRPVNQHALDDSLDQSNPQALPAEDEAL